MRQVPSPSRVRVGMGLHSFATFNRLNLLVSFFPHTPPNLPLEGGGVSGFDLCAYASLEGGGVRHIYDLQRAGYVPSRVKHCTSAGFSARQPPASARTVDPAKVGAGGTAISCRRQLYFSISGFPRFPCPSRVCTMQTSGQQMCSPSHKTTDSVATLTGNKC